MNASGGTNLRYRSWLFEDLFWEVGSDSHQDTYGRKKGIQILSLFFPLAHIFSSSLALIQELVDMKTGDFVFLCVAFCKHHGTYMYQVKPLQVSITHGTGLSGWVSYTSPSDCKIWWEEAGNLTSTNTRVFKYDKVSKAGPSSPPTSGDISAVPHLALFSQLMWTWARFHVRICRGYCCLRTTSPAISVFGEGPALGERAELSTGSVWPQTIPITYLSEGRAA